MVKIKKTDSGFTLLEILITLAISGFVIAAALKTFDYSNKSYIEQEDIAQMQQNARMAKYYIEQDLRITGYGITNLGIAGVRVFPFDFENNKSATGFLPQGDILTVRYIDDEAGSCGAAPPADAEADEGACNTLPQLNLVNAMPVKSSEAIVMQSLTTSPFASWDIGCWCGSNAYHDTGTDSYGFQAIITSPDGLMSDIVFITQVQPNSDKLQNAPFLGSTNKTINSYPSGSTINFFNPDSFTTLRYYVDSNYNFIQEKNGTKVTIAENIEDFQVSFCGDFNNDGVLNQADSGDWKNDATAVIGPTDPDDVTTPNIVDKIRFVKISILARTSRELISSGQQSTRPALEDHAAATTSDYYKRRPISVTVRVRNVGL